MFYFRVLVLVLFGLNGSILVEGDDPGFFEKMFPPIGKFNYSGYVHDWKEPNPCAKFDGVCADRARECKKENVIPVYCPSERILGTICCKKYPEKWNCRRRGGTCMLLRYCNGVGQPKADLDHPEHCPDDDYCCYN